MRVFSRAPHDVPCYSYVSSQFLTQRNYDAKCEYPPPTYTIYNEIVNEQGKLIFFPKFLT